jgi:hypothetical protein
MNGRPNAPLAPALIGGAAAGVLSGLPVIQCFCCLWIPAGAALAVFLAARAAGKGAAFRPADGAAIGAISGVAAAVAHSLVNIPFQAAHLAFYRRMIEHLAEYGQAMPDGWQDLFNPANAAGFSVTGFVLGLVIFAVIFAAFGALGGIIGAAMFGRKTPAAAPAGPPPPPLP